MKSNRGRCGDPPAVSSPCRLGARARTRIDALAAGAWVHGRDQEEVGGESHRPTGAAHPDDAFFEGWAKGLEGGDRELAELVEEQDAAAGEAHLSGPERPAATSDQRDDRGAVVWRTERAPGDEGALRQRIPGPGLEAWQ